ncbi:glycosyltransferase family 4 protein [Paenibacillus sp. GYB003]|uniref:glycosyltransferase family 4 protein n=1 Tax=Paenibacillus sp. GYB003 TaxID=2994392 RepID=UPI002F963DD9
MKAKRKVIVVGPLPPPISGQALAVQMLVDGFAERGVSYRVVNLTSGTREKIGTKFRALQYAKILLDYIWKTAFGKKTVYITIAQSLQGFWRDFFMVWIAVFFGHRILLHLHGGNYDRFYDAQQAWLRTVIRVTLRRADGIYVLGEKLIGMFDFEPALAPKISVITNGIPIAAEDQSGSKRLPDSPDEPIRLLYLSNLIESKGYLHVLEAVRQLVHDYRLNVKCSFYGKFLASRDDIMVRDAEHGRQLFETFILQNGLSDYVEFGGTVEGEAKIKALEEAHFFVLPTNYDNEGQPLAIIEALAYGHVVITTDYRAISDMVTDKQNGAFVPFADPDSIARNIADIASDHERYAAMSEAAKIRYRNQFTREAHLERMFSLLLEEKYETTQNGRYGRMTNV